MLNYQKVTSLAMENGPFTHDLPINGDSHGCSNVRFARRIATDCLATDQYFFGILEGG